jgi:hypothetical protein
MFLEDDLLKIKEKRDVITTNYQDVRMKKFASFTVETKLRQASEYIDSLEKKLNASAKANRTLTPSSVSRLSQLSYNQPPPSSTISLSTPNYGRSSGEFVSPSFGSSQPIRPSAIKDETNSNVLVSLVMSLTEEVRKMNNRITDLEKIILEMRDEKS